MDNSTPDILQYPLFLVRTRMDVSMVFSLPGPHVPSYLWQPLHLSLSLLTSKLLSSGQIFPRIFLNLGFVWCFLMLTLRLWMWEKSTPELGVFPSCHEGCLLSAWFVTDDGNLDHLDKVQPINLISGSMSFIIFPRAYGFSNSWPWLSLKKNSDIIVLM